MSDHVVKSLGLNVRSAADPEKNNVIAVLPQGHPVTKLGNASRPGWFQIKTKVSGVEIVGFLNGDFLAPANTTFPSETTTSGKLPKADLGTSSHAKRTHAGSRAHAIGESGQPGLPSTHSSGRAAGILRVIDWLDVGKPQHKRWQPGGGATFCNIYVYDTCRLAGGYLPRVWWTPTALQMLNAGQPVAVKYGETVTELAANYIFEWLKQHGPEFGWKRLFSPDDLQTDVNAGRLGIICAQRTNMNSPGHIQMVAPEHGNRKAKRVGAKVTQPLQSNAGSTNFTYGHLGSNWWQGTSFKDFGFWTNATG
jgi:hypothetical protein